MRKLASALCCGQFACRARRMRRGASKQASTSKAVASYRTPNGSVLRWAFHVINHQHFHRTLGRFEAQAELFTQRGENRDAGLLRGCVGESIARGKLQVDVELFREARFVDRRAVNVLR